MRMLPLSQSADHNKAGAARCQSATSHGMQPLLHFQADAEPIRTLAWANPGTVAGASDLAGRHMFATAGHGSQVKIWDSRWDFSTHPPQGKRPISVVVMGFCVKVSLGLMCSFH